MVYDTNVIVSAVLKAESLPGALLTAALRDRVTLSVSQALLDEYEAVLHRPKFGFRAESVEALLRDIANHALLVHPVERIADGVDAGDAHVLECAVAAQARFLVTGNIKHFPAPTFRRVRIVTPAECAPFLLL